MKQRTLQRPSQWFLRLPCRYFSFGPLVMLAACAAGGQAAFPTESDPDAGLIEIGNASPRYLLTVAVFDDSQECQGPKYVADLEKFDSRSLRLKHRETLSLWVTYTEGRASGLKACGAIYSLPYTEGDLRIVTEASDSLKQCAVHVSSSRDRKTWVAVPSFRKRIGRASLLKDDPQCERE